MNLRIYDVFDSVSALELNTVILTLTPRWDILYIYSSFITMPHHYFLHTSGHKNAFFPFWHEFQNSIPVKMGVLHSQTFTNRNDHYRFIVETAAIQALFQRPKRILVRRKAVTSVQAYPVERIQLFCPMY